ncbi:MULTISPECIES: hypothetical protein [unclassified Microcoleus]|uniref:hypothetical protein n=1 Tax=unclassified Microcoleus TaxID=2642155 RepID=UPI002FCFAE14
MVIIALAIVLAIVVRDESVRNLRATKCPLNRYLVVPLGKIRSNRDRLAAQSVLRVARGSQVLTLQIYSGKCLQRRMRPAVKPAIRLMA